MSPRSPIRARSRRATRQAVRRVAVGLLLLVFVGFLYLSFSGGSEKYRVSLRMDDASQLIKGNAVTVGGINVGKVTKVDLAPDRRAQIDMEITDPKFIPLSKNTRASLGNPSLAGVLSWRVNLQVPAQRGATIPDGGRINDENVRGIVQADSFLSALDADTRKRQSRLLKRAGEILKGSGPSARRVSENAVPLLADASEILGDLNAVKSDIVDISRDGSALANVATERRELLKTAAANTAQLMDKAVVPNLDNISKSLQSAPQVIASTNALLKEGAPLLDQGAVLAKKLQPSIKPAGKLLDRSLKLAPTVEKVLPQTTRIVKKTTPIIDQVNPLMPRINGLLDEVDTLVPLLTPKVRELRQYSPEITGELTGWLLGASGYYDANGGFVRFQLSEFFGGALDSSIPGSPFDALATLITKQNQKSNTGYSYNNLRRCPGSTSAPYADGSNRGLEASNCDPKQVVK